MDMFNDLFGENIHELKEIALQSKYTNKVETPIYEPKNKKPHILELVDFEKTKRIIR